MHDLASTSTDLTWGVYRVLQNTYVLDGDRQKTASIIAAELGISLEPEPEGVLPPARARL